MTLRLKYQAETTVPVEVERVLPLELVGKSLAQIERTPIQHGNKTLPLAEFFHVSGSADAGRLELSGNLAGVHRIGERMRGGQIHVAGDVGRHLGCQMTGGEIHVAGSAGDWVGGEMQGGLIHVAGHAGHHLGSAFPGSPRGMAGGTILVGQSAGDQIGHTLRRGLIAIGDRCGEFAGIDMSAGSIFVFGRCGPRPGAGMRRGTLALLAAETPTLLPTFAGGGRFRLLAVDLLLRELGRLGFPVDPSLFGLPLQICHGDLLSGGRGEILMRAA